jgi:molybdenum cofactor cytidylyltransferase
MPDAARLRVAGIILAAGTSTRMGQNKMLLDLEGEPIVRRATRRALAAGLETVVVVLGYEAERVRAVLEDLPCECVMNPAYTGPKSASLHAGLQRLSASIDAALVILPDMVRVSTPMLAELIARAERFAVPLIASRYGEVPAPPHLFRRSLFAELLAGHGGSLGRDVVRRHRNEAHWVDWSPELLHDTDTPEDYRASSLPV